jgi:iron complex transport system substrate-binding protein
MESGVIDKLSALHVPVLFVDYEIAPAKDTAQHRPAGQSP